MILFHGSRTLGLKQLRPMQADHDRPYIYLTAVKTVAALYLCNAVEKPCYWFPYGFGSDGVPVYHELYPNALREVSEGVGGCIYVVDADESSTVPFGKLPHVRLGTEPLGISDVIPIPDAYDYLSECIGEGSLRVSKYEDKTPEQLEWWYSAVADELRQKGIHASPDCSYARFVREKIPRAWELMLTGDTNISNKE